MAISQIELQYRYSGKGPVDAKSVVKTYNALLLPDTWYNDAGKVAAYNGMLVAVWLDADTTKNGVYRLHDPAVTSIIKAPDVANEANWHKLVELDELVDIKALIAAAATRTEVEEALANKVDTATLADYYTKAETYSKTEVESLLEIATEDALESIASILRQLEAHIEESTSKFASITGTLADYDTVILPAVAANTLAIEKLNGDVTVEGSIKKIISEAISAIPLATAEIAGIVKAGNDITVNTDGVMSIGYVSTDKLVQGSTTLVLSGGTAEVTTN